MEGAGNIEGYLHGMDAQEVAGTDSATQAHMTRLEFKVTCQKQGSSAVVFMCP